MSFSLLQQPLFWFGLIALFALKKAIHFVPQNEGYVVYRMGKYTRTLTSGMNWIVPFLDSIAAYVNLKEVAIQVPNQPAITKDNVSLTIDGVLFIKVIDAAAATNNITDYHHAVEQLAMTCMRNIIGTMDLDDCPQNRAQINTEIQKAMMDPTSSWGISVIRFELKSVNIPASLKEDMEKQMSAERIKRSQILTAEGVKIASIEKAQGEKTATILAAEADKAKKVLQAEADKESQILLATGEAEAIMLVAKADAEALKVVGEAAGNENGKLAVNFKLAQDTINAHAAIAKTGTIVLTDGKTGENVASTLAQAISVSNVMKSH